MGAALSHSNQEVQSSKSRREVFEERVKAPSREHEHVSLRDDNDEHHQPVASTSKAIFAGRTSQQQSACSYDTLSAFRAQDRDRKGRLRKLFNTLRQEWALPHDHTALSTHTHSSESPSSSTPSSSSSLTSSSGARQLTQDEKRLQDTNKEYLKELYHSLCPGDEAAKGKGPSFERFTQFVEAKEQALWELFCQIDKDKDMQLTAEELQGALSRADISISQPKLDTMISSMDKSGSGKVTFEEWRDFLLLLPRPASMGNVWKYWTSYTSPRLATSIANQDLDVILAEKPVLPPTGLSSSTSLPLSSSSSFSSAGTKLAGKQKVPSSAAISSSNPEDQDSSPVAKDDTEAEGDENQPIFAGSGAYLLAGGLAGAVSRTATAPFDRLKVYLINTTEPSSVKLPSVGTTTHHPIQAAKSIAHVGEHGIGVLTHAVRDLYTQAGIRAFFVGNGLNILKIFPESAVKFWSYEYSKRWFARNVDGTTVADISNSSRFVAGGIGGVTSQLLIYPLETWKTRVMSSTSGDPKSLKGNALYLATAKDMFRSGGVRAYYSGLAMGLIGVFPYSAIDMSLFAAFKKTYTKYTGDEEPGALGSLTFGALSGGLGATSVYPLNLLRTRMQTQGTPAHPHRYTGWRDVAARCYKREGLRGFYKGLAPTLLKVSPSMGISWVVYEYSTSVFFPRNPQETTPADTQEE